MDEDTQLALAIALSLQKSDERTSPPERKRRRNTGDDDVTIVKVERQEKKTPPEPQDRDLDYALALSLQDSDTNKSATDDRTLAMSLQYDDGLLSDTTNNIPGSLMEKTWDPGSVVASEWELTDPNPDIHQLFLKYDAMFFNAALNNAGVAVSWSKRMTL